MEIVAPTHCLDAYAVIAYLREETGSEVLKEIIERPSTFETRMIPSSSEWALSRLKKGSPLPMPLR